MTARRANRDCPFCHGERCARCDWSGWIDDRETMTARPADEDQADREEDPWP